MKALHGITIIGVEAWVWAKVYGGNGTAIGKINGHEAQHLWLAQRGTPPPMGEETNIYRDRRRYWYPWNRIDRGLTPEQILTPLCGRLRSQSKQPYLSETQRYGYNNECPNCLRLAAEKGITPTTINNLVKTDPWTLMGTLERTTMIDPVSGL